MTNKQFLSTLIDKNKQIANIEEKVMDLEYLLAKERDRVVYLKGELKLKK